MEERGIVVITMTNEKELLSNAHENGGSTSALPEHEREECQDSDADISLDITVLLDRSGSMEEIRDDAIGSFNAFLKDKQKKHPSSQMSIVLFDDQYLIRENATPIQQVDALTNDTFVPRGSTALLDAVGKTIQIIEERKHVDDEVLIAVLTDGQENSSQEYTLNQIQRMIKQKEERGWDFVYLSADPSAFADAQNMGFDRSKIAHYNKNHIQDAYCEMDSMMSVKLSKMKAMRLMKENGQENADKMYQ